MGYCPCFADARCYRRPQSGRCSPTPLPMGCRPCFADARCYRQSGRRSLTPLLMGCRPCFADARCYRRPQSGLCSLTPLPMGCRPCFADARCYHRLQNDGCFGDGRVRLDNFGFCFTCCCADTSVSPPPATRHRALLPPEFNAGLQRKRWGLHCGSAASTAYVQRQNGDSPSCVIGLGGRHARG